MKNEKQKNPKIHNFDPLTFETPQIMHIRIVLANQRRLVI